VRKYTRQPPSDCRSRVRSSCMKRWKRRRSDRSGGAWRRESEWGAVAATNRCWQSAAEVKAARTEPRPRPAEILEERAEPWCSTSMTMASLRDALRAPHGCWGVPERPWRHVTRQGRVESLASLRASSDAVCLGRALALVVATRSQPDHRQRIAAGGDAGGGSASRRAFS
jgi:hypothetical protein